MRLRDPLPAAAIGALGWSAPPRLFHWVTPETEALARNALLGAAATARPLHPDRGMHTDLEAIRACTRIIRIWDGMAARAGLVMASRWPRPSSMTGSSRPPSRCGPVNA
ncbi:hypothetical protein GCM10010289_63470 [Streptomyces violascens]|uniref:Uncharacterized protein n=1 Tax=Streptomyces violascens TaxID=67381 RepID=A0ABQ3QSQ7_9ACTN|nr:hypothetical protein GCM10010289_63470 [Streptomyces violascens]GHI40288.1 hypothetical protein Sviol_46960 [Streptomyces violascens]